MNNDDFHAILSARIMAMQETLNLKAKEYAQEDRLHNFKIAAQVNQTTPVQAAWGMATKHLVSVLDMIYERQEITEPMINEKIGDLINYMCLIEALMKEEINENNKNPRENKNKT